MINYLNPNLEELINEIIASQEFHLSPLNAENFPSRKLARAMTDREKALLTIINQIDNMMEKSGNEVADFLEREELKKHFRRSENCLNSEMSDLNSANGRLFCSDANIYYISNEDAVNRCNFCPDKETCTARGC